MAFQSILFGLQSSVEPTEPPSCFRDLNLTKIVESIIGEWKDYNLAPFFYHPLKDLDTITYRQEVMGDLSKPALMDLMRRFSQRMRAIRQRLAEAENVRSFDYSRQRCFLGAVKLYTDEITYFERNLWTHDLESRGMSSFREYLAEYIDSTLFRDLQSQSKSILSQLSALRFEVLLNGGRVTVRPEEGAPDYGASVASAFQKFRREPTGNYWLKEERWVGMNHIEAQIQDRVRLLYPSVFEALGQFCTEHADFLDEFISRFDREVQFYVAYLAFVDRIRHAGLDFCRPQVSRTSKEIRVTSGFDLALADQLIHEGAKIVPNDFFLVGPERILVVTGPNQGGKSTFARMFGQLHYLASLGGLVPGREARLFLFDHLLTHFEREEAVENLSGKLKDDLLRMRAILDQATPDTVLVLNEMFSSTTVSDALFLSERVMAHLSRLDLLAVWVTFIDELASSNEKNVSMVSTVCADNPAHRTFVIERRPADGLAYALSIAQKYRVTYEAIKERISE